MSEARENVYIIQPIERDDYKILHEEAISLIESADASYAGTIYQPIREINPKTYIGEGKLSELKERLEGLDVTVLFNGTLSPAQTDNISEVLGGKKVIDRTTLILDIFALHARSSEGKLQVELAQLKYLYPRLKGKGEELSRLGGGIGTRGPGETKLETDRRYIRARIRSLEEKLKTNENKLDLLKKRREKENVKTIALVGYTNTGKSTLLNALSGSNVLSKDMLFATLDLSTREIVIEGIPFLLTDTVGFLQDLPHQIIEAFHSTLESAKYCDLLLIVLDSAGNYEMQFETTLKTLKELDFHAPYLIVLNKCDKAPFTKFQDGISVSAKDGTGLEELKRKILEKFRGDFALKKFFVPYEKSGKYSSLRPLLYEKEVVYRDTGMEVVANIPAIYLNKFSEFVK